eukprot:CAMPEP_0117450444 /NCGR_PEP_ID=MMETSP0759-20121206/8471_1 /TAXON_ID=63605 /ORGANISM="Percolomonas cosmopolitus, Strain WS" /LENGTH=1318 /DNA_ID=CAMNT_0005242965 /DNA_START=262 /DNA_END=4214 /DNA_ORIENTATION=+
MSHQIPSLEELETFGEDSLEKWEVTSSDSFAYDDRLMQSYTMDEYYGETDEDEANVDENQDNDQYYYVIKKVPKRRRSTASPSSKRVQSHRKGPASLRRRAHRQQMLLLDSTTQMIADDSSEPEPDTSLEEFEMHHHAQTMIVPPPSADRARRRKNTVLHRQASAALNQTVPPAASGAPRRRSRSSGAGRKFVPPPRPIGPIMIRTSSGNSNRPVIISAAPMGRKKSAVRHVSGAGASGRSGRNAHSKKKPTRYRKLKRTDIRKSRLEGELQRTAQHLEDLKLALKVYNTLDNQDQQKLVDDVIYLPQQRPHKRTIPPAKRSTQRWRTATSDFHPSYNIDTDDFGRYEEDEDEIDDISDPHIYRQAGVLREQPVLRRAMGARHGNPVASNYNALNSIFSPRRTQRNMAPPPADTDSESSQVYMYDDDDISQHYQNMMDPDEEETSVSTITTSNSAAQNDVRSRGSAKKSRGSISSTTATAGQGASSGAPNARDINNMMVRSNIRAGAEETSLPGPDDVPDEDDEGDEEDLDDDEEEDEDGLPFTTSTNQQESQLFDQDKIGQETILQEVEYLMQQFKENLGFLFVILRELRNVNNYETRLACLKFFESCRMPQQTIVGGLFPVSQHAEVATNQRFTRPTPTLQTSSKSTIEESQSKKRLRSNSNVSEPSDSETSGPVSSRNKTSRSSSTSSSSAFNQRRPSTSEINKIAKQMPDEETSDDEDDEEEEDETSSNGSTSNGDDATEDDDEDDEEDEDNSEGSDNSEDDNVDSQTAKSKDLLETLNLKLISLVYDRECSKTIYTSKFLTQLSRDVLLTVSRFVPTATVELLESLHDSVMNYSGQNIISCRDDLIQDVLDMLYDETIFNRLMSNIDTSYKEDIAAMKSRLNSLKKQRKEDIDKLKNDRLARLKAGNPYPHTLVQPSTGDANLVNSSVSPTHRFRQGPNNQGHAYGSSGVNLFPSQQQSTSTLGNRVSAVPQQRTTHSSLNTPPQPTNGRANSSAYREEDEDEFDYGDNQGDTAEQYTHSRRTNEDVKEEEPVKRKTPQQRSHHTLQQSPSFNVSPRRELQNASPQQAQNGTDLGFILGGRKFPMSGTTAQQELPRSSIFSPPQQQSFGQQMINSDSSQRSIVQPNHESTMTDAYGIDGFSEISNQATFDLSSDFDYAEMEDPIDLANEVLNREKLRRSRMAEPQSTMTDDLSGLLSIDDLPSSMNHSSSMTPMKEEHNLSGARSRESLEKPMLVSLEEESSSQGEITNPSNHTTDLPKDTTDITEDVKDFVNLFGESFDRRGNDSLSANNNPTPMQHQSFSVTSHEGSPVIT